MNSLKFSFLVSLCSTIADEAIAEQYQIELSGQDGQGVMIGALETARPEGDAISYKIDWNEDQFEEHFLSMRPFKCVPAATKLWCHAPYPYEIRRLLHENDLTDLEYDLIFVWKPEGEYGIDLWNGIYYELEPTEDGWRGEMREYDLGILGVPPEEGELRPIDPNDLYEADLDDHPFPFIEIKRIQ